jgi:hypothetical protein
LYILTQSEGTGLVVGGFFSLALGAVAAVAGDALGAGVEEAVLAAGFCAQPLIRSVTALKNSKILFIDPPEVNCVFELSPDDG